MQLLKKEFLLFPDDLCPQDIQERISSVNWDRPDKYRSGLDRKLSLELAARIASGFPATSFTNQGPSFLIKNYDDSAHSVIIKGGKDGGLFIYSWSSTDRLIWPLIRGKILISRGDLEWISAYPFIHKLNFNERTILFNCCISEYNESSSTSVFLSSRAHFGHLARDTIAGQAYLALAYIKKCSLLKNQATFSFFGTQDKFLDDQLRFSLGLLLKGVNVALEQISHPLIQAGTAMIIKRPMLHVRTLATSFSCFDLQNELELCSHPTNSIVPIVHLGINGSPHRRILNQMELNKFLEVRSIPSLKPNYSPAQRYSLLRSAQVVIAEPSSSIYNYILNCAPSSLCILLLPGSFELELSRRDCCDWHFIIKHLINRSVIPFYGDRYSNQDLQSGGMEKRLIDIPSRYNFQKLEDLVHACIEKRNTT